MALVEEAGEWRTSTVKYLKTGCCKPRAHAQVIVPFGCSMIKTDWQMIAIFGVSGINVFGSNASLVKERPIQGENNDYVWRFQGETMLEIAQD